MKESVQMQKSDLEDFNWMILLKGITGEKEVPITADYHFSLTFNQ